MSGSEQLDDHERRILQQIANRNLLRTFGFLAACLIAFLISFPWIADRPHPRAWLYVNTACVALMFAAVAVTWFTSPRAERPDPRLTPRLRQYQKTRQRRALNQVRGFYLICLAFFIVSELPPAITGAPPATSTPWLTTFFAGVFLTQEIRTFRAPSAQTPAGKLARARSLSAALLAFFTVMACGLTAWLYDAYRPATLPRTIPLALTLGLLAHQLRLFQLERRATWPASPHPPMA